MVLTFALVGLGVWFTVRMLREELQAPDWFVMALVIGFSAAGLWWAGENPLWCFVVAGFAHFWYRLDEIVVYIRDWIKLTPLRDRNRR
jgi:hypothetical protein